MSQFRPFPIIHSKTYHNNNQAMFRKLQHLQKNKTDTKNKQTYAQRSANRHKMEESSYSRLHKTKKVLPSPLFNFHVVCNDYYIYQGQWVGECRNGEGIVFMKNGCLVIGHWHKDLLNGRSLILTPFGAMISATFINGKLNGWVLAQYRNKIILANLYFQDRIDGPRIMFEGSENFWMASTFSNTGQLIKITHVEKGTRDRLPLFVENDDLLQLFNEIVTKKNYSFDFEKIKTIKIAAQTNYIGFVDNQSLPSGLGATYSQSQCFMGYYYQGFLEQTGRMIFANGDIYHGGLVAGGFAGHGVYYNPYKNNTMVVRSQPEQEAEVLEQQAGYYLVDFELKVGEKLNKQDKIVFSPTVQNLMKTLQKYYHQYYIEARIKQQEEYSNKSQQHTENEHMKDIDSEHNQPKFIKSNTRWIANDNESAISEEMSLDGEKQLKFNFQSKGFYSPKTKIENQFNSVSIKENEEPDQKEKFNKQNPKINQYKKMFLNEKQLGIQASKSLDVNQLTFRGPTKSSENPVKINKKQVKQAPENFELEPEEEERSYYGGDHSSRHSSNITQMDEKLMGMMKKSNFRRKIFD